MHYVYLLISKKDNTWYIGCTNDLKERFKKHNRGECRYTKDHIPFILAYYEAGLSKKDAYRREIFLKSGYGRTYLRKRINYFLDENGLIDSGRKAILQRQNC